VTGGANGRGEQMRSFTNDDRYTPKARTVSNLSVRLVRVVVDSTIAYSPATEFAVAKKEKSRQKKVCVPSDEVYTKYASSYGVRILLLKRVGIRTVICRIMLAVSRES
jgi:hypothetical protein